MTSLIHNFGRSLMR